MRVKYLFIFLFTFGLIPIDGFGQYKIRFLEENLEAAKQVAKSEQKKVFVDTYAPWCVPCKKMEVLFKDPEVADFFNAHFVSVRINMDGSQGKIMHTQYEVVFLPTLLILDADGNIIRKEDRLLTKNELINMGISAIVPPKTVSPPIAEATPEPKEDIQETKISSTVIERKPIEAEPEVVVQQEPVTEPGEKILYILDEKGSLDDPNYLFNVAYLQLQLNDPNRHKTAKNYLATQQDWSTTKNMNFIYDFLYKTDSELFVYFIENRNSFEKLKGKDEVAMTVDIMTNAKLYQGFPRPNFDEAKELLTFIDYVYGERQAYGYILDRYINERRHENYLKLASEYIDNIDPRDDNVLYQMVKLRSQERMENEDLKDNIKLIKQAIDINGSDYKYFDLLAWLYHKKGMKKKALDAANKALALANENGGDTSGTKNLIQLIKQQ